MNPFGIQKKTHHPEDTIATEVYRSFVHVDGSGVLALSVSLWHAERDQQSKREEWCENWGVTGGDKCAHRGPLPYVDMSHPFVTNSLINSADAAPQLAGGG